MKFLAAAAVALAASGSASDSSPSDTVIVPEPGQEYWVAIERTPPKYPQGAARSRVNGCVAMSFVVESNGRPSNITVVASYPEDLFDREAVRALKSWRFEPGEDNPGREPALVTQSIDFEIEDAKNPPVSCVKAE